MYLNTTDTKYMIEEIEKLEEELEKFRQIRDQYKVLDRMIISQLKLDFVDYATAKLLEIDDQEKQKIIIKLIQEIQQPERYISYRRIQSKINKIKDFIDSGMDHKEQYILHLLNRDERNSGLNRHRKPVD